MAVVQYEKRGKIAYITLNRPEKLNAINSALFEELAMAWADFRDDDNLWVAILTGAGRAFSVGIDLQERATRKQVSPVGTVTNLTKGSPTAQGVWKPTIAAINGWAIAAGWYLALECDIRIASEAARMALREVEWGLPSPGVDSLTRHVPLGLALELLFTAQTIEAQRAYEIGLVNKVVPAEELLPSATAMAERICEMAPLAVRATKQMVYRSLQPTLHEIYDMVTNIASPVYTSQDRFDAQKAFVEKRKPSFKGR